jgi:hypothetical protein
MTTMQGMLDKIVLTVAVDAHAVDELTLFSPTLLVHCLFDDILVQSRQEMCVAPG